MRKKFKVTDYIPGYGYLICMYAGSTNHPENRMDGFSCFVNSNIPKDACPTDQDIKDSSKILADQVCSALNKSYRD
jgi:hypothetical protein